MTEAVTPRLQDRVNCPFCEAEGVVRYDRMHDQLFGAPGEWSIRRCTSDDCGLHWIDPVVVPEDLHLLYSDYYTHEPKSEPSSDGVPPPTSEVTSFRQQVRRAMLEQAFGYRSARSSPAARVAARLLNAIPFLTDRLGRSLLWLEALEGGRLLDIGCGAGDLLRFYCELGWQGVGLEPDPAAVAAANRRGLEVHTGFVEGAPFDRDSFDRITMVHVIEHVPDPEQTLRHVFELLKPGGLFVFVTPSVASMGVEKFGRAWRGWETPRHLHLGTPAIWARLAEKAGFETLDARSSAIGADWMYAVGSAIQRGDHTRGLNPNDAPGRDFVFASKLYGAYQYMLTQPPFSREVGEECIVTVRRPHDSRSES